MQNKKSKTNPKQAERKIKIIFEINEIENRKTLEKINVTKSQILEKIN